MLIKSLVSLLGLGLALIAYYLNWPLINLLGGLIYLVVNAWLWGNRLKNGTNLERLIMGGLAILAFISLSGALVFYINLFKPLFALVLFTLLPWLGQNQPLNFQNLKISWSNTKNNWLVIFYIIALIIAAGLLWQFRTDEAWRSPWQTIPNWFFLVYFFLAGLTILINRRCNVFWLIPFYWLSLSLLPIIFPLGYAFDPIIHQATAQLLQLNHTISPKPFYYLGQYGLEVLLADFLKIHLNQLDLWLIPLLAGLTWPALLNGFKNQIKLSTNYIYLVPLLLTLPLFTITTPLALSYLWALLVIFLIFPNQPTTTSLWLASLFALSALVTHPIIGLPLLGLVLWKIFNNRGPIIKWLAMAWLSLAVPLSFIFLNFIKPNLLNLTLSNPLKNLNELYVTLQQNLPQIPYALNILDTVYLWGLPLSLTMVGLALLGYGLNRLNKTDQQVFIWPVLSLTLSYLILKLFFHFNSLPDNEQNFYNLRLWHLALLTLWPLVLLGANWLLNFLVQKTFRTLPMVLGLALLLTASWYLNYPRFDLYQKDTAYPTTPRDVKAVKLINDLEKNNDYVVLSNQAVAAAAVQTFGFSRYYNEHYFYPLPTGTNPLYQTYLQASQYSQPDRLTIKSAADLTNLNKVYLILNRYWANFDQLNEVAAKEANETWLINNGTIAIYYYQF
ncbi:hypothetical protein KKC17_00380 [Patescibacteria group bacterium]|nr:hypothetical protein [Patescibacteria group bacterium]